MRELQFRINGKFQYKPSTTLLGPARFIDTSSCKMTREGKIEQYEMYLSGVRLVIRRERGKSKKMTVASMIQLSGLARQA